MRIPFLRKEMQFTILQNDNVAAEGVPTVVTGMLFSCVDTRDVLLGTDKSGKTSLPVCLKKHMVFICLPMCISSSHGSYDTWEITIYNLAFGVMQK
jgi:hypothetical protein